MLVNFAKIIIGNFELIIVSALILGQHGTIYLFVN